MKLKKNEFQTLFLDDITQMENKNIDIRCQIKGDQTVRQQAIAIGKIHKQANAGVMYADSKLFNILTQQECLYDSICMYSKFCEMHLFFF